MVEHAESVVSKKLCEKLSFWRTVHIDRMLNGEQKEWLKLPDVAQYLFIRTFVELLATDALFSPVLASQELRCHAFVLHLQL